MIVRTIDEITDTDRDIVAENGNWRSKRITLGGDKVGFSYHETVIKAGTENEFHYANHVEAVWLISGTGRLLDRETGEEYPLGPGTMYLLDKHDKHTVKVEEDIHCACVFNPPVTGREVHDENGVYPLIESPA